VRWPGRARSSAGGRVARGPARPAAGPRAGAAAGPRDGAWVATTAASPRPRQSWSRTHQRGERTLVAVGLLDLRRGWPAVSPKPKRSGSPAPSHTRWQPRAAGERAPREPPRAGRKCAAGGAPAPSRRSAAACSAPAPPPASARASADRRRGRRSRPRAGRRAGTRGASPARRRGSRGASASMPKKGVPASMASSTSRHLGGGPVHRLGELAHRLARRRLALRREEHLTGQARPPSSSTSPSDALRAGLEGPGALHLVAEELEAAPGRSSSRAPDVRPPRPAPRRCRGPPTSGTRAVAELDEPRGQRVAVHRRRRWA